MDRDLTAFVAVLIVTIAGLSLSATPTGNALQIVEMREYRTFSERLCPDPAYPVPVFEDITPESSTGKQAHVDCVAQDTVISTSGRTFFPEINRKRDRLAYGHEQLSQ